jgi:hypothetical protein
VQLLIGVPARTPPPSNRISSHASGLRRIVTLEAALPPLLVVESKSSSTVGVRGAELKTKTVIIQLAGLPLFFPNPMSVQLSFKGLEVILSKAF